MVRPIAFVVLLALAVIATSNHVANPGRRWLSPRPTKSVNPRTQPFHSFAHSVPKQPRVPGTKTVPGCGKASISPNSKIVGGQEVVPHSYPWQVALVFDDKWFCGGTILNEEWILTAGHCTRGRQTVDVLAGAHDISEEENTQVVRTSTAIYTNADYNSYTVTNDAGLIKMTEPLTFNEYISPVCLPSYSDVELPAGTKVTATGWGITAEHSSDISHVLNEVSNTIMGYDECKKTYGAYDDKAVLCTDTDGGQGICNGDSGGPLNYVRDDVTYIRGIASFVSSSGCTAGLPDGFGRVIDFLSWIESTTGIMVDE